MLFFIANTQYVSNRDLRVLYLVSEEGTCFRTLGWVSLKAYTL